MYSVGMGVAWENVVSSMLWVGSRNTTQATSYHLQNTTNESIFTYLVAEGSWGVGDFLFYFFLSHSEQCVRIASLLQRNESNEC